MRISNNTFLTFPFWIVPLAIGILVMLLPFLKLLAAP